MAAQQATSCERRPCATGVGTTGARSRCRRPGCGSPPTAACPRPARSHPIRSRIPATPAGPTPRGRSFPCPEVGCSNPPSTLVKGQAPAPTGPTLQSPQPQRRPGGLHGLVDHTQQPDGWRRAVRGHLEHKRLEREQHGRSHHGDGGPNGDPAQLLAQGSGAAVRDRYDPAAVDSGLPSTPIRGQQVQLAGVGHRLISDAVV